MNQQEFAKKFSNLTAREQEVLLKFLAGERDAAIAYQLKINRDTVRRHIANICKKFGITDQQDPGVNHRPDLITLFAKYRPDLFTGGTQTKTNRPKVLLSYYHGTDPDKSLATQLETALTAYGYDTFIIDNSRRMAANGLQQICTELNQSDCLVLLLSKFAASSEMATEEVRLAKSLHDSRPNGKPFIVAIRIDCPIISLNHDLRGHLQGMPQYEWQSADDNSAIMQTILASLASGYPQIIGGNFAIAKPSHSPILSPSNNSPPQPVAEPELPRGQVDLASVFYIQRPRIDERCYEELVRPGALIRIKAPRQMGKTSLLARILYQATTLNYRTVPLSFQLADSKTFTDLDQFLQWFCAVITLELQLPDRLNNYWNTIFGSKISCKSYFERYLLTNITEPLVLGLDEVDRVFQYPELASDFFGLLRAWHEESRNREIWRKLRLVVVHSTEVYVPMDVNQSPFNVGLPIELAEFTSEQVQELATRYQLAWGMKEVEQVMALVGGHPYLVRLAMYYIARQELSLAQLLETAPTDTGLYSDHLRRHLWNLSQQPELAAAFNKVVATDSPVHLEPIYGFKLHSMGLVHLQGNQVTPRYDLYRQYFCDRLVSSIS